MSGKETGATGHTRGNAEDQKPEWIIAPTAGHGILQLRNLSVSATSFRWLIPAGLLPTNQTLGTLKLETVGRLIRLPDVNMREGPPQTLAVSVLGDNEACASGKFERDRQSLKLDGMPCQEYFIFTGTKIPLTSYVPNNIPESR